MIAALDKFLSVTLATLMALMVADVTWQIFTRFVMNSPSGWTEELARYLLIWIGLLGAAWAYRRRAHLGLSYFVDRQSETTRHRLGLFAHAMVAFFALAVMVYGGLQLVTLTFEMKQTSAALGLPIGYVYCVLPLSGVLITIYALDFIRRLITGGDDLPPHDGLTAEDGD